LNLGPGGNGTVMRSEIETVVEDIKRSVGLLRRHL
jgi:tetrahydromethanopterin S-methyltransferase subunit F